MSEASIILTRDLTKHFTPSTNLIDFFPRMFAKKPVVKAVEGVTIDVQPGEIFALLGPNGAGKTTLIKMLCTLIFPTRGEAIVDGYNITRDDEAVRRSIGLVTGEERSFYWRLTGKQNLKFFGALHGLKSDEVQKKIEALVDLLDMQEYVDTRFNEYSTGMKQHLAVARCLLSDAKILFMDEPTKSLDHSSAEKLRRFIKERIVGQEKKTVVFTTHVLREAADFADRVALMDRGVVKALGTLSELKRKTKVPEATIEDIFKYFI
jgi:ABC-2 type transport system ATP-binding protein